MNKKQRNKNRATAMALRLACPQNTWVCDHCGERTNHGHFVPPCFGDPGFFACKPKEPVVVIDGSKHSAAHWLLAATMEPWEEAMATKGICPKCSDSLSHVGEGEGMRFTRCLGCHATWVISSPNKPKEIKQ